MLCGNASWVALLLCACVAMLGPMGHPVDNAPAAAPQEPQEPQVPQVPQEPQEPKVPQEPQEPQVPQVLQGQMMQSPAANPYSTKHVRPYQSMCPAEQDFIQKRKYIAQRALNRLGIKCPLEAVPHVALLGSGGGQRAAVGLVGSLYQLQQEGLLDTILYLGGVSAGCWSISSLYSDQQWSSNMDTAVSRLSGPGVQLVQVLTWLGEKSKEDHFSLTDVWGVLTSAGIMKQLDPRRLSDDGINPFNPYPVYNAVNKKCLQDGPANSKWFELTPHKVGFIDLGLYINTTHLGIKAQDIDEDVEGPDMDSVKLLGIVGSVLADKEMVVYGLKDITGAEDADEDLLLEVMGLWNEVPKHISRIQDILEHYMRACTSLLKLIELIRKHIENHHVLSCLDRLEETLKERLNFDPSEMFKGKSPEEQKHVIEQWRQNLKDAIHTWIDKLHDTPVKQLGSWLMQKMSTLLWKWEWGTTENFLYQYPDPSVPSCIRDHTRLQLIDAGVMINMPYPSFLGHRRDADLLIALEHSADITFKTLTLARDYAAAVNKPFPELPEEILAERDWPRDFYVFDGKGKAPTIIYMPLFNRRNCKDAEEIKAKMREYNTFQLPFCPKKVESLLETAKANIKFNKANLVMELYKASMRRHYKSYYDRP